ncbi:hypothetical protein Bca4012_021137 [Brassica carinata]|uniref:EF-hand domain-containing protein n=1 Tax=Brassica carinata TaxID=52824 RepID=A0A8X7WE76_BRACI|nr:hypothetical protein Bca52824_000403 [Brassica carinata]
MYGACETGFITKEKLMNVMKSMGKNPKAKQLQEMMSDVDIFGNSGITFDDFFYIMAQNTYQVCIFSSKTFNVSEYK